MFVSYNSFLIFLIYLVSISETKDLPTCKLDNEKCINEFILGMIQNVFDGVPDLGIEPADPMFFDQIKGNLPFLKYNLYNSTITGYKKCIFNNINFNLSASKFHAHLSCPSGCKLIGDYEADGKILSWNVGGKGDFNFLLGAFDVNVDADAEIKEAEDGKLYIKIKSFNTTAKITSPFKARFNNLFNGNKELSEAVHQVVHENWEIFAEMVQDPLLWNTFKKIFRNINTYLKKFHFEKI